MCECWCCRPIGPRRPERLPRRTVDELLKQADDLAEFYYEAHPEERPDPAGSDEEQR